MVRHCGDVMSSHVHSSFLEMSSTKKQHPLTESSGSSTLTFSLGPRLALRQMSRYVVTHSNNLPLHPGSDVAGFKAVYAGYLSRQGKKSRFNFSKMKHLVSEVKLFLKVLKILDYSRVKYSVKYQFQIQYHLHRVFLNSHEGCVCKSCFMNGMDRTFIKCLHE